MSSRVIHFKPFDFFFASVFSLKTMPQKCFDTWNVCFLNIFHQIERSRRKKWAKIIRKKYTQNECFEIKIVVHSKKNIWLNDYESILFSYQYSTFWAIWEIFQYFICNVAITFVKKRFFDRSFDIMIDNIVF